MTDENEEIDARLARLGRATEAIGPRADFGKRVMRALDTGQDVGWWSDVLRPARRVLPVAALAAAFATVWAAESDVAFDDALSIASDDAVELEW